MSRSSYNIYPSLLDAWQNYLDAESNWESWYGGSDDPKVSLEEYLADAEQELIDRINRVPFESEAADRGTAFNEVVDCLITGLKTDKDMEITASEEEITVLYKKLEFVFDASLCRQLAVDYKDAIPQYHCVGVLPTEYGDVTLYGYIDELLLDEVHDIKTTKKYEAFKFRNHWQHIVYPFCLNYEGVKINTFQYDVVKWGKDVTDWQIFTEYYEYVPERDIPRLRNHVEGLIEFIISRLEKITDKKIFNALEGADERENRYGTE